MLILQKAYCNRGNHEELDYVKFIQDIDTPEDDFHMLKIGNTTRLPPEKNKKSADISIKDSIHDVLKEISLQLNRKSIRLLEFCRDFDRLRVGSITNNKLRSAFDMAKISISLTDFATILSYYASDKIG